MSFKIRDNFSSITTSIGKNSFTPPTINQIGKVYGVVTMENTPTEKQFKRAGGFNGIGTIFYLDYNTNKNIPGTVDDAFLDNCQLAKPINSQTQDYPFNNELVQIVDAPASANQSSNNTTGLKYYTYAINLYNNPQQNSQPASNTDILGPGVIENSNLKPLISFPGDRIFQGRQGNAIRFSTTNPYKKINEWSSVGKSSDPILILTNGFGPSDKSSKTYVEKINKDASSIYLTSTQKLPLQVDKTGILNNITNPIEVLNYINPQVILNSDRIVLNSKRDEVMLFAKTNIEINTKNIINLNADGRVHLNSDQVILGSFDSTYTPQPVLLGYNTIRLFQTLQRTLTTLGEYLASTSSTKEGSPIPKLNAAGKELLEDMKSIVDQFDTITSKKVYTI